jgi:leucine dehydrogenase
MRPLASATRSGNGRPAAAPSARASALAGDAVPPVPLEHEELVVRRGERSGIEMVVAVHSTVLGPALGGVRVWHYRSTADGVRDALRLSAAMTMKAAAAGLDLGGGKAVICAPAPEPPAGALRRRVLLDFGDLVESLGGRYITAEDVGIDAADLVSVRERTRYVTGLPVEHGGAGDPSPYTARGVEAAMRSCIRHRLGRDALAATRVVIVGLGHVGGRLAWRLAEDSARLGVTDIDPSRRRLAEELGAEWLDPEDAMLSRCDVLAPCALGGAINAGNVDELDCEIVCGAANNQLAEDALAARLAERGIVYAPDFIANAGGLIHVYRELRGYGADEAVRLVEGIEPTMDRILAAAETREITPLDAARELARERLEAAVAA